MPLLQVQGSYVVEQTVSYVMSIVSDLYVLTYIAYYVNHCLSKRT